MLASDGRFKERHKCGSADREDCPRDSSPRAHAAGDELSSDAREKTEPRIRLRPTAMGDVESIIVHHFGNIATSSIIKQNSPFIEGSCLDGQIWRLMSPMGTYLRANAKNARGHVLLSIEQSINSRARRTAEPYHK